MTFVSRVRHYTMKKFDIVFQPRAGGETTMRLKIQAPTGTEAKGIIEREFPGAKVVTVEEVLPFHSSPIQTLLFPEPSKMPSWGTYGT